MSPSLPQSPPPTLPPTLFIFRFLPHQIFGYYHHICHSYKSRSFKVNTFITNVVSSFNKNGFWYIYIFTFIPSILVKQLFFQNLTDLSKLFPANPNQIKLNCSPLTRAQRSVPLSKSGA